MRHVPADARAFSHAEAKRYYDRLGSLLDTQLIFEGPALKVLLTRGCFDRASAVFEFGCGTGRFAQRLLSEALADRARYVGVDISATMVRLASERVRQWGPRAEIRLVDASPETDDPPGSFDRFVSTYVVDLLSEDDIRAVIAEAGRLLERGGLLCLASLTRSGPAGCRGFSARSGRPSTRFVRHSSAAAVRLDSLDDWPRPAGASSTARSP